MKKCSPSPTSIMNGDRFNLDQCTKNHLERETIRDTPYASTVGSLMNAHVCTIPDITYVARVLGRYQSNLGFDH